MLLAIWKKWFLSSWHDYIIFYYYYIKKAANPSGLALYFLITCICMYSVGKAEEKRRWLPISELKISVCLCACEFCILNFGFWILNFDFWFLEFEFWFLCFQFWVVVFRFWNSCLEQETKDWEYSARIGRDINLIFASSLRKLCFREKKNFKILVSESSE